MTAEYVDHSTGEILTPAEWAETPAEIAVITGDPTALDSMSSDAAAVMVTKALQESRSWLAVAMRGTDPTPIAEFKAWAATIEEATRQKKLGREIELDAAEMVRRAERGIGVAIRNGQKAGEIGTERDRRVYAGRVSAAKRAGLHGDTPVVDRPTFITDIVSPDEWSSNDAGIGHLTDGVTDEQFDAAVTQAKAEGNLSRANVVRKVKGETPKPTGRHELLAKTHHHNANRIVEQTVIGLEGYALSVGLIDFAALDPANLAAWSGSLATSLQSLNRLSRRLKELDQA